MSPRPQLSKHVNIDGDIICYSVGFASEQKDGDNIKVEPVEYALFSVKRMIESTVKACKAETYNVILTGDGNFREEVATITPYKGNREGARKPTHYQAIRDYIMEHQNGIIVDGEEADDYLGYMCVQQGHTIASLDKDLDNVPGWHYNWNREELYYVSQRKAAQNFHLQLLTGDKSVDNINGLYQMTGVRASKKLKDRVRSCLTQQQMYNTVREIWLEAYDSVGMCLDEREEVVDKWLHEIGTLLWIRHKEGEVYE